MDVENLRQRMADMAALCAGAEAIEERAGRKHTPAAIVLRAVRELFDDVLAAEGEAEEAPEDEARRLEAMVPRPKGKGGRPRKSLGAAPASEGQPSTATVPVTGLDTGTRGGAPSETGALPTAEIPPSVADIAPPAPPAPAAEVSLT